MTQGDRRAWRAVLGGAVASLLSSAVITLESRRWTGRAASGTNATSQWIWGDEARRRERPSPRHTVTGYAIHHASSLFWAAVFDATTARRVIARPAARAAVVAATAAFVDYAVMPRRFSPGIEAHLPARSIATVYAAFGLGLWIGERLHRRGINPARRPDPGRRPRDR